MEGGILEVLLVHAEGIKNPNIIGKPKYYVIIECGSKEHRSKVTSVKDGKALWNDKFTFQFSLSEWNKLKHLKIKIMDVELFSNGRFVGESMIYLGGMVTEAIDRGVIELKPCPHNVVIEDEIYKGEIKIGIKLFTGEQMQNKGVAPVINRPKSGMFGSVNSLFRFLLQKAMFRFKKNNVRDQLKET